MQSPKLLVAIAGALALSLGVVHASEHLKKPDVGFGQKISEADVAPWDIEISAPSGKGLPPGEGTVSRGKQVYEAKCLACHGAKAEGGPVYGSMVGGIGSMTERPRKLTPGSMYPYAPILFDYTRRAMPMDAPQSLTNDEVYAVSAYILHLNELIPEDFKLNAETMAAIEMPNRDAFITDDRPDTQNERCMTNCQPIGTVEDGDKNP
ncbi:MAG: c-type cytochrome [Thioalkalivibrio sp.]